MESRVSMMQTSKQKFLRLYILSVIFILLNGCSNQVEPQTESPARSAILITIDTHRGDHLGFMGNPDIRTPALDRLSKQSTIFTEAYTNLPLTLPTHAAMMTSMYPREIGVEENTNRLNERFVTLAEILKTKDFATAAYPEAVLKFPRGLERGFDEYHGRSVKTQRSEIFKVKALLSMHKVNGAAEEKSVVSQALRWIDTNHNAMKRYFLWMHFFDPHIPYNPPKLMGYIDQFFPKDDIDLSIGTFYDYERNPDKSFPSRDIEISRVLYRNEIFHVDTMLETLFRKIQSNDSTKPMIVVTSDHGESLHRRLPYFGHGFHVTLEELHVPFLVYSSDNQAKIVSDLLVQSVDVAPTILDALDVPGLPGFRGRNVLTADNADNPPIPFSVGSPPVYIGAMGSRYKVVKDINAHEWNYWDRKIDPAETFANVITENSHPDVLLLQTVAKNYLAIESSGTDHLQTEDDPAFMQLLESLGYIQ
jgi:choline-sulfatase